MLARPVLTALSCRSCQHAVRRVAVAAPAWSRPSVTPIAPRRLFSSELPDDKPTSEKPADEEEKPWFLEVEPPRHAPTEHKQDLPHPPEDSPALLGPLIQYVHEDMGLDEISLLDLRQLDPPASLGPNLIMLFATARSERHLHISSGRFVRWLRRNYGVSARADGLIGAGELKTKLRRLRKKAKLMGSNTAMIPGGDNGISTGWVCVNFRVGDDGQGAAESASFDESGRMSGFGAARPGTTVVVQCLTEGRRGELDLETLWKGIFRRSLQSQTEIKGEKAAEGPELDELLTSKLQIHTTPAKMQWESMRKASERRMYSTTARQSPSDIHDEMSRIQLDGSTLQQVQLRSLTGRILQSSDPIPVSERLSLLDQLLLTASERGLDVNSRDMLSHLIASMATSPAYGEELGRAQKNLEFLLSQNSTPPTEDETVNLMSAYASRQDWDRVWDAFRTPARFKLPRGVKLYELAYELILHSNDKEISKTALRWIYPEMVSEPKTLVLIGTLYEKLKDCIRLADPNAEQALAMLGDIESEVQDEHQLILQYRMRRLEFAQMLRHIEARNHYCRTNISQFAKP